MITVFGEGRGFRVAWLLEEMGLAYRLRQVDMLAGVENDPEFLAINPGGFIPAIQDGGVVMVESVAIMQYLMARHGPTPLAPEPGDPAFPHYLQFLHLGEAGMATPANFAMLGAILQPEAEQDWTAGQAAAAFDRRRRLIARQLEQAPYLAGEAFTAADIVVTYALQFASRTGVATLDEAEAAYVARTTARPAYERAMDACPATKGWVAQLASA